MNSYRALVVDDSLAMRRILRQIVAPLGLQIAEAGDAREALQILEQHPELELVLFDSKLSGLEASQFVQLVKSDPRHPEIKLVLVTTNTEPSSMARALMSGIDEVLMKPFTPAMFLDKLQRFGISRQAAS